ncbi:MAG: V-type ATPase subunit [Candidatus Heimdallarchaeota archaeon]
MLRDAREYGSLNVHMRCKRTELFTAGTYNLLASAADFNNLRQMLANTKYDDIIGSEMVKEYPNLIEIDRRLVQNFVDQYNLYRKFIPKRSKSFIEAFSKSYFLNNIKVIISALHGANRFEDARGMLISLSEAEDAEIEELFKSKDVEDLISRIKNKDLKDLLDSAVGEYRFLDLVYPLIIAVDQYYYSAICEEISNLKGEDKTKIKSLLGTRIGLQNLEIILRSKNFNIASAIVKKWLIATKYCPLKSNILNDLINSQDLEEAFNIIQEKTPHRDLATRLQENLENELPPLENFDRIAEQIVVHKANSIFRSASFNISIFPAFFILKEIEIRNIRTIILGKIHKRSTNEVLDNIILV